MNKKLITTLVMSSLVASAFAINAGAANDKQVLKDDKGAVHNVVGKLGTVSGQTVEERALKALDKVSGDFGFAKAQGQFKVKKSHKDEVGITHTKMTQVINGIAVLGGEMIVHEANGDVQGVTGSYKDVKPNATKASLDQDAAIEAAVAYTGFTGDLELTEAELVYAPQGDTANLAYNVRVRYMGETIGNWAITVDAVDGSILNAVNEFENVASVGTGKGVFGDTKTINTDLRSGTYYLEDRTKPMSGIIRTRDFQNWQYTFFLASMTDADNVWNGTRHPAGVDAHYYAGKVFDYYYNELGRLSWDGAGASVESGVHYGSNYNNAGWTGSMMVYGDGDGTTFANFAGGYDVIAHELQHAVTDTTSDLVYQDQPGALNESWSDAMAAVMDSDDWLIGEDIYTPGVAGDALRSMSDPNASGDPAHMNEYVVTTGDNGGVHTNSGIPNKAFYNFATSIGSRSIAGKIWYVATRDYMTTNTQFSGARAATLQATAALYGSGSSYYTALQNAWSAVGIY